MEEQLREETEQHARELNQVKFEHIVEIENVSEKLIDMHEKVSFSFFLSSLEGKTGKLFLSFSSLSSPIARERELTLVSDSLDSTTN